MSLVDKYITLVRLLLDRRAQAEPHELSEEEEDRFIDELDVLWTAMTKEECAEAEEWWAKLRDAKR